MSVQSKAMLFVLFFGCTIYSIAQNKVDSLFNLFSNETDVNVRSKLSYEIAKLTYRSNPNLCKQVIFESLSDSNEIEDKYMVGRGLNTLGIVYQYQSFYDTADFYFKKTLQIARTFDFKDLEYKAYNNIALIHRHQGQYEQAIEMYVKVLKAHEENEDSELAAGVMNDIGNTYLYMENYEMGINYQKMALNEIAKLDSLSSRAISIKANTYNSIGYAFGEVDQTDSALYYYELSLPLKKQINNLYGWANTKGNICIILRPEPEKCIDCLNELLKIQEKINDRQGIVRSKMNLAVSYSDVGLHQQDLALNLDILNNYTDVCDNDMTAKLYKNIAGAYKFIGDYKNAYEYRKKYDQYQDSLRTEYYNNDILEITEKYQTEKKEKEIASQKLEIASKDLKISNRNKFLYGLGGGIVAIVFFGLFLIQRNKRKAQEEKDKAIIAERDRGLVAVFNAQEEERKRVAKDLHDGIGQQISAIIMQFNAFASKISDETEGFAEDVGKIKKLITNTGADIRNISHRMMPRALTELGLIDALNDMLETSFSNSNIIYKFEHHNMSERLSQNLEIGLYRIAQELVNNILKHSGAGKVDIQLIRNATHCILLVQDDGKGISDKNSNGIGLRNMNSRLNALNGELNLESDSNSGTTAIVKIALM